MKIIRATLEIIDTDSKLYIPKNRKTCVQRIFNPDTYSGIYLGMGCVMEYEVDKVLEELKNRVPTFNREGEIIGDCEDWT